MSSPKIGGRNLKGSIISQVSTKDLQGALEGRRKRDKTKINAELARRG